MQNILDNGSSYFLIIARALVRELVFDYIERAKLKKDSEHKKIYLRYAD